MYNFTAFLESVYVELSFTDGDITPKCVWKVLLVSHYLGGGFNNFYVHPDPWGNDPIWRAYFSKGLKPPTSYGDHVFVLISRWV